ncbi:MAG: hypothetical protein ACI9OJ_002159 [Myxococcota bacterium]|jgi:hypothetical protein
MSLGTALAVASLSGCSATAPTLVFAVDDPASDTRLTHPPAPSVTRATFDLRRLTVERTPERVQVTATFGSKVRALGPVPDDADRNRKRFLPTVDIYIDAEPNAGHVMGLPGRDFVVPATQAWDRALVLADLPRPLHPDAWTAEHLTARGRRLVGHFPPDAVPETARGFLVVVTATALSTDGWVRAVSMFKGDCSTWDDNRCTLIGSGPPIMDSTDPAGGGTLALSYGDAPPPPKSVDNNRVPVVFHRGPMVTVAPVQPGIKAGDLATLFNGANEPLGTAVVDSVLNDAATLKVVGARRDGTIAHVVFGGATQ